MSDMIIFWWYVLTYAEQVTNYIVTSTSNVHHQDNQSVNSQTYFSFTSILNHSYLLGKSEVS